MSEKFEPCTLEEATHVEVNGVLDNLHGNIAKSFYKGDWLGIKFLREDACIPLELFPILGIKPLKEVKPEPIEFEAVFVKHDNHWHPLYSLDYGFPCQKYKSARFKCVQILEEEK